MERLRILLIGMLLGLSYGLQEICVIPECKEAAHEIKSNLNENVDPCEDFYKFSCGGWISRQSGKDNQASKFKEIFDIVAEKVLKIAKEPIYSNSSRPLQQAKKYFKSCLNVLGYEDYVKAGGYPLLQTEWNPVNFTKTLKWISEHSSLLNNNSHQTAQNRSLKHWAILLDGKLGLNIQAYLNPEEFKEVIKDYKEIINKSTKILCSIFQLPFNQTGVQNDIEDLIEFETQIAQRIFLDSEESYSPPMDPTYGYNISALINEIEPDISGIDNLLNNTPFRTLCNYFMWINFVLPALRMNKLTETVNMTKLEKSCALDTAEQLRFILEAEYIEREFYYRKILDVLELYKNMYRNIKESIRESNWMLPEVQMKALHIMNQLDITVGYPNWITHPSLLNYFYNDLEDLTEVDVITNFLKIKTMLIRKSDSKTGKSLKLDVLIWKSLMSPNAFYDYLLHSIRVLLPFVSKPFLQKNVPAYLSYGGIGFILGHELVHALERSLGLFSNHSDGITNEKVNCINEQFAEYKSKLTYSIQSGGIESLMEDLADTGGLQLVLRTYKNSLYYETEMNTSLPNLELYSSQQLFFMRFAQSFCAVSSRGDEGRRTRMEGRKDPHSLGKYRILASLSNSKEFAEAFECSPDSPMNRGKEACVFL